MAIEACSSGTRPFTHDEEEALKKDESTSAIMNRARQHATGSGKTVELRGDDKTRREVDQDYKKHVGNAGKAELFKAGVVEGSHLAEIAKRPDAGKSAQSETMKMLARSRPRTRRSSRPCSSTATAACTLRSTAAHPACRRSSS